MRKLILALSLVGLLIGCAQLQTGKQAFLACKADPVCWEEAKHDAQQGQTIGATVGASVPVPGGAAAGAILGYGIMLAVSAIRGGLKLIKKPEITQPTG